MRTFILALLAATALGSTCSAADSKADVPSAPRFAEPVPGPDPGIRNLIYNPTLRARLTSTGLVPLWVILPPGEYVDRLAGLYTVLLPDKRPEEKAPAAGQLPPPPLCTDWCATKHDNQIIFQPLHLSIPPSIVVVATKRVDDPAAPPHYYNFELHVRTGVRKGEDGREGDVTTGSDIASPTLPDKDAYFTVMIQDVARVAAAKKAFDESQAPVRRASADAAMENKARDRQATSKFNAPRYTQYRKNESADCSLIGPTKVSDDGMQTEFHFAHGTPVSQIYKVYDDENKTEEVTESSPAVASDGGNVVSVHTVWNTFVLRRGPRDNEVVCGIYRRDAFNPAAPVPATGTRLNDVILQVRGERRQ